MQYQHYSYEKCERCGGYFRVYITGMELHWPKNPDAKFCSDEKEKQVA